MRVLDKVKQENQDTVDTRKEEDFQTIWPFLVPVFWFFFNTMTTEVNFAAFIYEYARCSDHAGKFEKSSASRVTFKGLAQSQKPRKKNLAADNFLGYDDVWPFLWDLLGFSSFANKIRVH